MGSSGQSGSSSGRSRRAGGSGGRFRLCAAGAVVALLAGVAPAAAAAGGSAGPAAPAPGIARLPASIPNYFGNGSVYDAGAYGPPGSPSQPGLHSASTSFFVDRVNHLLFETNPNGNLPPGA
ncbi:MAG: hypothetical protein ACYCO3_09310, partial [Mycobacteriales bacterium]